MSGIELVLAGCSVVLACAVGWLFLGQPDAPPGAAKLTEIEAKVDSLFKLRLEWQTVLEQIEDTMETVERKRRRAAASASRGTPAELADLLGAAGAASGHAAAVTAPGAPEDRLALRRRALAAGRL